MGARRDLEAHLGIPVSIACKKGKSGDSAYLPMDLHTLDRSGL